MDNDNKFIVACAADDSASATLAGRLRDDGKRFHALCELAPGFGKEARADGGWDEQTTAEEVEADFSTAEIAVTLGLALAGGDGVVITGTLQRASALAAAVGGAGRVTLAKDGSKYGKKASPTGFATTTVVEKGVTNA